MRQQPEFQATPAVLSVSPVEADHLSLEAIIGHPTIALFKARDLRAGLILLREHDISVVVCERDLRPGTWIDMLEHIKAMPNAPSLIVASRLADERLWAEALNLGAWDVLATPFEQSEVIRSVKSGWQRWHDRVEPPHNGTRSQIAINGT